MRVESVTRGRGAPIGSTASARRDEATLDLTDGATAIAREWQELCTWDPALPPDAEPPMAVEVVGEILAALERPQPLGWGADPEIQTVAERFAAAVGPVDIVIGMLICLREAVHRHLGERYQGEERLERDHRMQIVVDRAISVAAIRSARSLEERAYNDPVTGLPNRWALERDMAREIGRAGRHDHELGVLVLDIDGLKVVNDSYGHAAGDETLRALAGAMRASLRQGDAAYRVGGDEFVLLLSEIDTDAAQSAADAVVARMHELGAPAFSWGSAIYPADGTQIEQLLDSADVRLLDAREARGHHRREGNSRQVAPPATTTPKWVRSAEPG